MGWAYKGFEQDASVQLLTALERTASRQATAPGKAGKFDLLKKSMKNKTTLLGATYILYVRRS